MASSPNTALFVALLLGLYSLFPQYFGADILNSVKYLIRNHPVFLKPVNEFSSHQIRWADTVRNCEDVVLDESTGTAIFSCDPGRDWWNTVMGNFMSATEKTGWLHYYKYADDETKTAPIKPMKINGLPDAKASTFHPLGSNFDPKTRTLYVVNHGEHPPGIEVFSVSDDATTLTYKITIKNDLMRTPNSVQPISDHEIYFTNDHHYEVRNNPILAKLENFLHIAKGNVVYLNFETGESRVVAQVGFANGIALLHENYLAVASTTTLSLYVYEIQADHSLTLVSHVPVGFWIDNLRMDSNGVLLMTGHPYALHVETVAKNQHKYNMDAGRKNGLNASERPRSGSVVAEWDGNADGNVKRLYYDDGKEYGTSTTTVRDVKRGVGFTTGLYEKGILQFTV